VTALKELECLLRVGSTHSFNEKLPFDLTSWAMAGHGSGTNAAAAKSQLKQEAERWRKIVPSLGIKPE